MRGWLLLCSQQVKFRLALPYALAIDGSGNVWLADEGSNTVIELYGGGSPVVTPIVASLLSPYGLPAMAP